MTSFHIPYSTDLGVKTNKLGLELIVAQTAINMANINAPMLIILYLETADYLWQTWKLDCVKIVAYFAREVKLKVKRSPMNSAIPIHTDKLQ